MVFFHYKASIRQPSANNFIPSISGVLIHFIADNILPEKGFAIRFPMHFNELSLVFSNTGEPKP